MQSWALTSRIYAGDRVKTTCERPQGHVPGYPWLRWGQGQWQPGSHETHPMGERDAQSTSQGEHPQSSNPQGLLSWGCVPIPPASTQIRITVKKQICGLCSTNQGADPPQGGDNRRVKGRLPSISRAGSGHRNISQKSIKGVRAQTSGPTSRTRGQTPGEEELGSCSLQNGDHKHRRCDKMRGQRSML